MAEKGSLAINSENMFPIIKKWLYSDQDIFLRELVSNGCDAITKLKKLDVMGEYSLPEGYRARIDLVADPAEKTLQITDNGIGMTGEEVKEYINNIAFSGAEAFLSKYKDKANNDQIIGHFGLGFYSAFMVAGLVTIDTLSYQDGAKAVHWECDGSSSYSMEDSDRKEAGTTITLHLSEDCVEYSNYYKIKEIAEKYCSFMPVEIWLSEKNTGEMEIIPESQRRPEDVVLETVEAEKKEGEEPGEKKLKIRKRPVLLNETAPLFSRNPSECTEEEYKEFYRKVFNDYKEPLFWIHLNMDYPFNLKGILYFPKINLEYESAEGKIKLYNNQVFIADNIREVIPEFLMLLKGVIDCPDLPLNVSRSALQNDGFVKKISDYITKKVADKLSGMCRTEKEVYEKYWEDISPFIKYGCLKDDKFCAKMTDYILFRDLDGRYLTLPEALEVNRIDPEAESGEQTEEKESAETAEQPDTEKSEEEKKERIVYYVTDEEQQAQYVRLFRSRQMQAFAMKEAIDQPFMQQLEMKNEGIRFSRIDGDLQDALKAKVGKKAAEEMKAQEEKLSAFMKKALKNEKLQVKLEKLKDKKISSLLTVDEQSRRFRDMMKMYAAGGMDMGDMGREGQTLVLNAAHPLVQYLLEHEDGQEREMICAQLYDLAQLQNAPLDAEAMIAFVNRSNEIMMLLTK